MWTQDDTLAYLKGKGKGKRAHTSGKGFGRRGNPRDRNGDIMKCHNCSSEEHLAARCPQKGSGKAPGEKAKTEALTSPALPSREKAFTPKPRKAPVASLVFLRPGVPTTTPT